jgi:hypothetical protein
MKCIGCNVMNEYGYVKYVKGRWVGNFVLHFKIVVRPVRIRVRIDPLHPLVCRKRRLNGVVLRMRPEKPRSRVTAGVAR